MKYDVIVVGAGSAGAVLASRLSADAGRQVLLLEAGPDYRSAQAPMVMRAANPSSIITLPEYSSYRWDDLQARRTAQQDAQVYWRGRGVGGSSAVNGQIAIRPVVEDFAHWQAAGGEQWRYESVLPAFCRLEEDMRYGTEPYHGSSGPIPIYRAPVNRWGAVDQALAESALDHGFAWAPDHNAPGALGVSPYAINSREGQRVSTNDGYLEPVRGRNNLTISGDTLVHKILLEQDRAIGVRVERRGRIEDLHASEILLCAGAIHSPAILQRSGIGPDSVLKQAGIEVHHELPVGDNLQDHPLVSLVLQLQEHAVPEPGFRHTNCCVRYSSEDGDGQAGDLMLVAMNRLGDSLGRVDRDHDPVGIGMLGCWLNAAFSAGQVAVHSADPRIQPQVELNMLDDERDRRRLRGGVRTLAELAQHDGIASIAKSVVVSSAGWSGSGEPMTPRALLDLADDDLDTLCLASAGDTQHATSTCRMGNADDETSVVDGECRVHGIRALRVIDASVMPRVPSANTHLATVMIAEHMLGRLG